MKHHSLSKRDYKELGRYLRAVADMMGLRDWEVMVGYDEPSDPQGLAEIECVFGQKKLIVSVCKHFKYLARDNQRHTICHELVHPHFDGAAQLVLQGVRPQLSEGAADMLDSAYRWHIEHGVNAIADFLAPHLPLIEWPK